MRNVSLGSQTEDWEFRSVTRSASAPPTQESHQSGGPSQVQLQNALITGLSYRKVRCASRNSLYATWTPSHRDDPFAFTTLARLRTWPMSKALGLLRMSSNSGQVKKNARQLVPRHNMLIAIHLCSLESDPLCTMRFLRASR